MTKEGEQNRTAGKSKENTRERTLNPCGTTNQINITVQIKESKT